MDLLNEMIQNVKNLNKNDMEILNYCFEHIKDIENLKVKDIASATFVSSATVVRFCKKLGFNGFLEFKNYIKFQFQKMHKEKIDVCIEKDIEKTFEFMKQSSLEEVAKLIDSARRIEFFGTGATSFVCHQVAKILRGLGLMAFSYDDNSMMTMQAETLDKSDLILVFSVSGETSQVIKALMVAKEKQVKIVSITGLSNNTISRLADISFYTGVTTYQLNERSISSHIELLLAGEMIVQSFIGYKKKLSQS